jgi:hypothetical protein
MAVALLDGSNANIDISFGGTSYKTVFNYWSADLERDFTEATVFSSGGWRARIPGLKRLTGRADGYASKGAPQSDPTQSGFTSQTGVAIVLTADTGCTFTFTGFVGRAHTGLRAAANSEFSLEFESTGTVTVAWVVT